MTVAAGRARSGQSLLELLVATTLIALALVPALRLFRDSMQVTRDWESHNEISTFCASLLEQHVARANADWKSTVVRGDLTRYGHADLNYQVVQSDASAAGGVPDALMAITATVWQDANGNNAMDSGEPAASYATKVSKLGAYPDAT